MTGKSTSPQDRAARLAAALRANLHKRKAQARAMPRPGGYRPEDEPDQPDQ
jgi:hypothetical protein